MKALTLCEGRLEVVQRDDPLPGPGEVVVGVRACGINAADLLQRRGLYPAPPGWTPDVPGLEMAGLVLGIGAGVDASLEGRRVCAIVGGGAQATRCRVPAAHLIGLPEDVDWVEAGGVAEAVLTAHDALLSQGHLRAGERVLISGAAGGVGVAAVQIAHSLGAHVVAVTRDDTHHSALADLGASQTITLEQVQDLSGIDLVLELLGAAHLERALGALGPHGRVVVIGVGAGSRASIDLLTLMNRRVVLTGSTLRSREHDEKAAVTAAAAAWLNEPWPTRDFHMPIAQRFDLAEAEAAYEAFARPGKFGKIVLSCDDT